MEQTYSFQPAQRETTGKRHHSITTNTLSQIYKTENPISPKVSRHILLTHLRTMTTNHYSHVQLKSPRKRFTLILMTTTIRENHQAHPQGTCVNVIIEHIDP